jgi:hypothetical protein
MVLTKKIDYLYEALFLAYFLFLRNKVLVLHISKHNSCGCEFPAGNRNIPLS